MKLQKWECGICGFEWFESLTASTKKRSIDHGCPQGCDDAGQIVGQTQTEGMWLTKTDKNTLINSVPNKEKARRMIKKWKR